ncbi:MAG: polyprenyl synthetase family protein [Pseudomonadota bacterium]
MSLAPSPPGDIGQPRQAVLDGGRATLVNAYLGDTRRLVIGDIHALLPQRCRTSLYDIMLDYPLRTAKMLRPALCIAMCRALGGRLEDALRPATVLELFHNAFLIHDDIEDGAQLRRGEPALHHKHGISMAINVGDGMLALATSSLRAGTAGLERGIRDRVFDIVDQMGVESAEGQALELAFTRWGRRTLSDRDYIRLVYKKTCWYSFVAPLLIGAAMAGAPPERTAPLHKLGGRLGVAFQIHDDVLNLTASASATGKDAAGDLKEGKCTLILIHALRLAEPAERVRCEWILRKKAAARSAADVRILRSLIDRRDSIGYARAAAARAAARAADALAGTRSWLPPSTHRDFIEGVLDFVTRRNH